MPWSFVDHRIVGTQQMDRVGSEGGADVGFGVEVFDIRRAAGAVFELLRGVALQQQQAAGFEGGEDAFEKRGARGRWRTQ